ncbi:MAG: alpha/beta hydrolase, partial [Pseudomonadota bacterium]|nr:alpha/beta hydrolase [Pseudomonadota bacterium]
SDGLLFIHGGGAHAHWWSFIAPFFAENRPVAAIDLSGMGDSGHRTGDYGSPVHIPEIAAVIDDAPLGAHPVVVGHSFGGYMTMSYAAKNGANLSGVVIVDAAIRPGTEDRDAPRAAYDRPKRYYPDKETIVGRYRLMPEQPNNHPFLLDHVAEHSVREEAAGWTWKFDIAARGAAHFQEPLREYVRNMRCRKAMIYGAESYFMIPEVLAHMKTLFGPKDPVIAIPAAHHHLTMDQPLAFVIALRTILSGWDL